MSSSMSYAGAVAGNATSTPPPEDPPVKSSKKDKHDKKSKKEKRSGGGIAPIDADSTDDETVRALRDKMAALHSQIAALEQKRTQVAPPAPHANLPSTTESASSLTQLGGSSVLTHVGMDGGSDGRFLAHSTGNLLAGDSDQTLAVHSDGDYDDLIEESAKYMNNNNTPSCDTPLQGNAPKPLVVGRMNPAAQSFTPSVTAPSFVPGGPRAAAPAFIPGKGPKVSAPPFVPNRGSAAASGRTSTANKGGASSRPSNTTGATTITMTVDPDAEGDKEPQKTMSYNKNHHHDVVRDLMMLMKAQLALSKTKLNPTDPADEVLAAERRLESGMSTRPGFAQFSKSSNELHEVNSVDEQRATAAAMVRSVLGEHASESLSVSHTPDGEVHLADRLRELADNPEAAARLLASLTEMEANAIAKEVFSPPSTKDYVVVEYKRERTKKFPCDIPSVIPGDYVIVDGDRGTDCGLVVQVAKARPNHTYEVECMSLMVKNNVRKKMERGRVIRLATTAEIFSLHNEIAEVERDALHLCRNKCIEHNIEVDLVDCEVQFDRKKVSFFFNSPVAVDFRALVRDLYNIFHIRIWMENVSPRVRNAEPFQPVQSMSDRPENTSSRTAGGAGGDSFSVGSSSRHQPSFSGRGGGRGSGRVGRGSATRVGNQQQSGGGHNNYGGPMYFEDNAGGAAAGYGDPSMQDWLPPNHQTPPHYANGY